ncbi:MAG: SOS response-associated peptidase [Candidatus Marinimicrobia bacterium]|nr:SOS response-associated peptidase [Candidatus Neomarinimicrobiota bacterium]MBT6871330.1 SOS response-associated peptidase [Candidatus Neomarinimicrobiota bacterium]|tara:strand:+ start:2605 stop:3258 length:654 start_codon:yes stop_codon:yes gene_type:complete
MCFNISIVSSIDAIEQQFNAEFHIDFSFESKKHISAFTNPKIPVITSKDPNMIQPFYWGLIPHWVKDVQKADSIRRMTYNAKSETVHKKPSFRDSIKNKKCLIIADGFYEWQSTSSGKICHYIQSTNDDIFAFAGIWSEWVNQTTGELLHSTSILTQPANTMMAEIHNIKKRQPVILEGNRQYEWLKSSQDYGYLLDVAQNISLTAKIIESPLKNKN